MKYYIILLVILLLLLIYYHESTHIKYYLSCLFLKKNKSGLPTPSLICSKVISIIRSLPDLIVIDFGCGGGDFIECIHSLPNITQVIGIELNEQQALECKDRFSNNQKIQIQQMNMMDYMFPSTPFLLYMYEPLWDMNQTEALSIYHHIMKRITSPCYIIYISGINALLNESFFSEYSFEMIHYSYSRRYIGLHKNHIYLFQLKST